MADPEELERAVERLRRLRDAAWAADEKKGVYGAEDDAEAIDTVLAALSTEGAQRAEHDPYDEIWLVDERVKQLEEELKDTILHVRALAANLSNAGDYDWAVPSAINFADEIADHADQVLRTGDRTRTPQERAVRLIEQAGGEVREAGNDEMQTAALDDAYGYIRSLGKWDAFMEWVNYPAPEQPQGAQERPRTRTPNDDPVRSEQPQGEGPLDPTDSVERTGDSWSWSACTSGDYCDLEWSVSPADPPYPAMVEIDTLGGFLDVDVLAFAHGLIEAAYRADELTRAAFPSPDTPEERGEVAPLIPLVDEWNRETAPTEDAGERQEGTTHD